MNESGQQEEALFDAARQLTDHRQRVAFLDVACGGDAGLRRRLDALFAAQPEAEAFFETPVRGAQTAAPAAASNAPATAADAAVPAPTDEVSGTLIGRYKLLQKIGDGGFGAVYVAEQQEPVKRLVAFKIIKLGMDTHQVVARFEAERQALALMDHPNIAKVFDAGATESGRPYFVMELVRGVPITQHCDEHNLPPAGRLELFMQVCRAIQHAHQKGIIHRDIKPSNILVTLQDGVSVPKVIDFGIAKATQMELTEKTIFTQFHQFIGTPAYMSPEQAERSGVDIDTRSDIYSLGVLLYELLTGKTPFDGRELLAAGLEEMRRTIREVEPVKPSTRLTQELVGTQGGKGEKEKRRSEPPSRAKSPSPLFSSAPFLPRQAANAIEDDSTSPHRLHQLKQLIPALRGDLDWIVMKALEKDRTRRYETANGLASDIQRHLSSEPVEARPPSQLYRLQKFARRNKLALITAGFIATLLMLGGIATLWLAIRATKAEQRERRNTYIAEMNSTAHALTEGNLGRARQLLARHLPAAGQTDLRKWEWRYLASQTRGDQSQWLIGHTELVNGLFFLDDNELLSVGWDRQAIWWDVTRGRATHTLVTSNFTDGLTVAPGHHLAVLAGNQPAAIADYLTVLDLDRHSTRPTPLYGPPTNYVLVDFSPAGQLATASAIDPGPLALWDADAGKQLAVFADGKDEYNVLRFSLDGRHLAAATREGMIQIWDVASRSNLLSWSAHAREGLIRPTITTLAFSSNGSQLVSAGIDGLVAVWDSATGAQLASLHGPHAPVSEAAFSPDGRWLAGASADHALYIWETTSWGLAQALRGHSEEVRRVAWSPNSRRLASGGLRGELLLWDWPPRTNGTDRIASATISFNLAETGDTFLRVLSETNPVVEIWDTKTLRMTAEFMNPDTNIVSTWILPGGRLIVCGDKAGRVGIRELTAGHEIKGTNAHKAAIYGIVGSADGRVIVTASKDNAVLVWDLPELTVRHQFRSLQPFDGRVVTADGSRLAIGYPDGNIELRDLRTGQQRAFWKAHSFNFKALAFSPDGTLLASSSWDRTGKVWDVARPHSFRTIGGNLLTFESLVFSPDGSRLAAGTGEGTVKLFDVATVEEVATFTGHHRPVYCLAFGPGGRELISASFDALCVWRAPSFEEIAILEKANQLVH